MALWEYLWAWSAITQLLLHLNWDATDTSGNWTDWTSNNMSWVWGTLWSWAGSFNWTSSRVVLPNIVFGSTWTISIWANFSGTALRQLYFYDQVSPSRQVGLRWSNSLGRLEYWVWNGSTETKIQFPASSYNDSIRHNIVVTNNAWATVGYVDWEQKVSWSIHNVTFTWTRNALGVQQAVGIQWYNWLLDEYIHENRTRTHAEVNKYYTYAKGRFN